MSSGTTSRTRLLGGGAVVVLLAAGVAWWAATRGGDPLRAPYHDAAALGSIGLCDRSGHQVDSGSTTVKPFVWRAEGTTAASGAYAVAGHSATLYAFQPRAGVEPVQWSGQQLTAAGTYRSPAHPTAAGTAADTDLASFVTAYPPQDHGFVQLRLYLAAPGQPDRTDRYDALDLTVSGSTWRAVGGAHVDCSAAHSVSFETQVGLPHAR